MDKPDDFIIWYGDHPISLLELEAWSPGISAAGLTSAVELIPMFLGHADAPVPLSEQGLKLTLTNHPEEGDSTYTLHEELKRLEDKLTQLVGDAIREPSDQIRHEITNTKENLREVRNKLSMMLRLSTP